MSVSMKLVDNISLSPYEYFTKKIIQRAILVFTVAAVAVAFLQNAPRRLGNKVILTNYNGNECLSAISNGGQL